MGRQAGVFLRWGVLLRVLLLSFGIVYGQEPTTETLVIGGITHTLIYDASVQNVDIAREVLETALPRYNVLFGFPGFSIEVVFQPGPKPGNPAVLADASPRVGQTPFCIVNIFRVPGNANPEALKFTLAHEFSHCYQYRTRPNSATVFGRNADGSDPMGWWVEGTAEWMASLVYPPVGDPIATTISDAYIIANTNLFEQQYEKFWFFQFLAQARGSGTVINLIRRIPRDPAGQVEYLNRILATDRLFARYGRMLLNEQLRHQPALNVADVPTFGTRRLPDTVTLQTSRLAVNIAAIQLAPAGGERGIRLHQSGGFAEGYRVILKDGTDLSQGNADFCGSAIPQIVTIAVARGDAGGDDSVATVDVTEIPCDSPAPGLDCTVGTWHVYNYYGVPTDSPYLNLEGDSSGSSVVFEISAGGRISATVAGTQNIPPGGWMRVAGVVLSGQMRATGRPTFRSSWWLFPIEFSAPLVGTGRGPGGKVDIATGILTENDSLSGSVQLPAYTHVECANPRQEGDRTVYDALFWYVNDLEYLGMFR